MNGDFEGLVLAEQLVYKLERVSHVAQQGVTEEARTCRGIRNQNRMTY